MLMLKVIHVTGETTAAYYRFPIRCFGKQLSFFVTIYTPAVTFYVHLWDKSIIFKKEQHFYFRGGREGEETARCGI